MPLKPELVGTKRPVDQPWIFYSLESPINIPKHSKIYQNEYWKNAMNWSMTYRVDSDINKPYGYLIKRTVPITRNYSAIFKRKTKMAAWIVSHCPTESLREVFVKQLQEHGFEVDVYGDCGKQLTEDRGELINRKYKFYLSFENSLCKDYITEKFFLYYQFDAIMIVRGGADYSTLLPNDTFIDTSNFNSIKDLANYLLMVGSSEVHFTDYMKKKEKYFSETSRNVPYCNLCKMLNNIHLNRKSYKSMATFIHNNTCYKPDDIKTTSPKAEVKRKAAGHKRKSG